MIADEFNVTCVLYLIFIIDVLICNYLIYIFDSPFVSIILLL